MSDDKRYPKTVDEVVFVWVARFEGGFGGFWISIHQPSTIHVFEPEKGKAEWLVLSYHYKSNAHGEIYEGTEGVAFRKAAEHAKKQR